ncbi:MAG: hypothetical protein GY851_28095 [bacterium]|nr:hypothetical protein [bacterium]
MRITIALLLTIALLGCDVLNSHTITVHTVPTWGGESISREEVMKICREFLTARGLKRSTMHVDSGQCEHYDTVPPPSYSVSIEPTGRGVEIGFFQTGPRVPSYGNVLKELQGVLEKYCGSDQVKVAS